MPQSRTDFPSSHYGIGKKGDDFIVLLRTDMLINEVTRVSCYTQWYFLSATVHWLVSVVRWRRGSLVPLIQTLWRLRRQRKFWRLVAPIFVVIVSFSLVNITRKFNCFTLFRTMNKHLWQLFQGLIGWYLMQIAVWTVLSDFLFLFHFRLHRIWIV